MKFTKNAKGVEVLSDSGHTYQITLDHGKPVICSCKGSIYHVDRRCRHIKEYERQALAGKGPLGVPIAASKATQETLSLEAKVRAVMEMPKKGPKPAAPKPATQREPMRAEKYDGERLAYPMWLEPKLDGLRCVAFVGKRGIRFLSRSMKPLYNMDGVARELAGLELDGIVLDGEVCGGDTFGGSVSIMKASVSARDTAAVTYVIFDILAIGEWERGTCRFTYEQRRGVLEQVFRPDTKKFESGKGLLTSGRDGKPLRQVRLAPRVKVATPDEVRWTAQKFVDLGFEGGMLKDPKSPYVCDRAKYWRKVKFVDDYDVVITNVQAGKGKHEGRLGAIEFLVKPSGFAEAVKIEAGTGFSDEEREAMWALHLKGRLIGKVCEVGLQRRPSGDKSLFATFRRMRPDKDKEVG